MANNMNIGLWFDKILFKNNDSKELIEQEWSFYEETTNAQLSNLKNYITNEFEVKTIYPGLVCGIGYEHEIGYTNEFKHGFSFDYTTGLPYIPGSSIKGTLRSAFKIDGYIKSIIENIQENSLGDQEFKNQLIILKNKKPHIDWHKVELAIFEGKEYMTDNILQSGKCDIFFDSFIYKVQEDDKLFLCDDYITSHKQEDGSYSPLKEPNPVRFIKVRPNVAFKFQFRLSETDISDEIKLTPAIKAEIFKQILLDLGIGAKTNVGYGQFI